jgi:hypothetical protein
MTTHLVADHAGPLHVPGELAAGGGSLLVQLCGTRRQQGQDVLRRRIRLRSGQVRATPQNVPVTIKHFILCSK